MKSCSGAKLKDDNHALFHLFFVFFLLLWQRGGEFIPISKEEESSLHAAAAMIPLVRRCRLIFP
jgi:hypothetical protein